MIRFLQIFLFLFVFSLDVSIQAKVKKLYLADKVKEYPVECLLEQEVCSIRTSRGVKYNLTLAGANIMMSEETSLKRKSGNKIIFLEGTAWIESLGSFTVQTPQGDIHSKKGAEFIITRSKKNYIVDVLKGIVNVKLVGFEKIAQIKEGTSNKIYPVSEKGHAEVGLPVAFDYQNVLETLASLHGGTKGGLLKKIAVLKEVYSQTLKDIALLYKREAVRTIASHREEKLKKEREEEERIKEERYLRDLYRKKVFGLDE